MYRNFLSFKQRTKSPEIIQRQFKEKRNKGKSFLAC